MPKLKVLSGKELIRIFFLLGFEIEKQRGSHIKLLRMKDGKKQTLTIPNHKELDKGTFKAIIRQSKQYLTESEILINFYSE